MRLTWLPMAALLLVPLGTAAAQERTVNGVVTDSATGEAVSNADVAVKGTLLHVQTRENGRYILPRAPSGDFVLVVRAIGFHRQEVTVTGGQNQVDVVIGRDIFRLEEVVI